MFCKHVDCINSLFVSSCQDAFGCLQLIKAQLSTRSTPVCLKYVNALSLGYVLFLKKYRALKFGGKSKEFFWQLSTDGILHNFQTNLRATIGVLATNSN